MARLVTVAGFVDHPQAYVAKALLEQHGFCIFLFDESMIRLAWHYGVALGGLKLMVPDAEAEAAKALLAAPADIAGEPIDLCPECGSEDVFRQPSRPLGLLGFLMAGIPILVPTRKRRCRTCDTAWRRSV